MELDYALLADGVAQRPDGKVDVFGAGIDRLFAAAFPVVHPSMTLAVRIKVTHQEAQREHTLEFHALDPDGTPRAPVMTETIPAATADQLGSFPPDRALAASVVVQLQNLLFERTGPHAVLILWDGTEIARRVIYVDPLPTQPAAAD